MSKLYADFLYILDSVPIEEKEKKKEEILKLVEHLKVEDRYYHNLMDKKSDFETLQGFNRRQSELLEERGREIAKLQLELARYKK